MTGLSQAKCDICFWNVPNGTRAGVYRVEYSLFSFLCLRRRVTFGTFQKQMSHLPPNQQSLHIHHTPSAGHSINQEIDPCTADLSKTSRASSASCWARIRERTYSIIPRKRAAASKMLLRSSN